MTGAGSSGYGNKRQWNKLIGPGGGTRRLHHKQAKRPAYDGGETGSTRV